MISGTNKLHIKQQMVYCQFYANELVTR